MFPPKFAYFNSNYSKFPTSSIVKHKHIYFKERKASDHSSPTNTHIRLLIPLLAGYINFWHYYTNL